MMERYDWIKEEYLEASSQVLKQFTGTIENLKIPQDFVKGNVLIVGHGPFIPERLLVCTPESSYRKPKKDINFLYCCDSENSTHPRCGFNKKVRTARNKFPDNPKKGSIYYYPGRLQEAMQNLKPNLFDTAMMFRIDYLDEQFPAVLRDVARILKDGGTFLGSGSFVSEAQFKQIVQDNLTIKKLGFLPNPDHSGFKYDQHLGFILQK